MLNNAINKYNKRAIEELIALAKGMNDPYKAGEVDGWWDGSLELYRIDVRPWCSEMDAGVFGL
ncbi:hypothetical protein H4683_002598 [Filibacter limicola]|uniref:Uncharacterized protein n=1 Tax=Sporosarcina limicola TaxID=34101 RepID=A0A927MK98_9BACL|nr:hypothetical protein [Sporosarcina limicola]MBE1555478.1 hypothetical protein [Sporosarcina limicola]